MLPTHDPTRTPPWGGGKRSFSFVLGTLPQDKVLDVGDGPKSSPSDFLGQFPLDLAEDAADFGLLEGPQDDVELAFQNE